MALALTIATEVVKINPSNWSVIDKINTRSSFSFTVVDKGSLTAIQKGDPIAFSRGATTIFNGFVDTVDTEEIDHTKIFYQVNATDNCVIADRRLVFVSVSGEYAGDIVTDEILPTLAEEGVTAGTIDDGFQITKVNFPYYSCTQALDALSEITGFYWNIDNDKKLNFRNRVTDTGATPIDDDAAYTNFKLHQQNSQYRNVQYLRAGKGQTTEQTNEQPTPAPDGISKNFIFKYPFALVPTIQVNIASAGWTAQTVGLTGVDEGKDWYWTYGSNVLVQEADDTELSSSDLVRASSYYGLYELITIQKKQDEINARLAIEGGTGQYESLVKNTDINTEVQAEEYTTGILDMYGRINNKVSCLMYEDLYTVGELVRITKSSFGLDSSFLLQSITIYPKTFDIEGYKLEFLDGSDFGGWENLFKRLINANKSISISENEVAIRLVSQHEEHTYQGQTWIDPVTTGLFPANDLYPSATLYPDENFTYDEVLND